MPTYRRRESVVFLKDVNKHVACGGARKGDTGVVSSWSKGGWLKVRLDRHGAIVTVRAGPCIGRPTPPAVPKKTVWSQEARGEANRVGTNAVGEVMKNLFMHLEEAQEKGKPADVEVIEDARLEL